MRAFNIIPWRLVGLVAAGLAGVVAAPAATVWNGPAIGFYHSANGLQDQLAADVHLTRGSSGGLYNAALEAGAVGGSSPAGTAWAVGTLANYSTLHYGPCPLEQGNHPPGAVNTTYVVHLTSASDNIYFQLTLTNWGGQGGVGDKTFGYLRTTPAPAPSIAITNPASGAVFAAPATIRLAANAAISSGTITNVQFFTNGAPLKALTSAPFTLVASNLAAGTYALSAVATAGGITATSAPVTVSVVNPAPVQLSAPALSGGQLTFHYSANPGLSYVIQRSANLVDWLSVSTNTAATTSVSVGQAATAGALFYRIGLLPNP